MTCGGPQTLATPSAAATIAAVSTPLDGRACGHALLISSVAVLGHDLVETTAGGRRLLDVDDGGRVGMERELRERATTWETHSRLRRHHATSDVVRHHTKQGYSLAPNDASHHPFGEVRPRASRVPERAQDIKSLPDPGDEPLVECSSSGDSMRCRVLDVPRVSTGGARSEDVSPPSGGPHPAGGVRRTPDGETTAAPFSGDAPPAWMDAVSRAGHAGHAARVAELQSRVSHERRLAHLLHGPRELRAPLSAPVARSPSRHLLIFGSIGGAPLLARLSSC